MPNISSLSRVIGFGPRFHASLVRLLELGYKCRIRLPLFISAGFVLCHIFSNYVPRVEINVEVIEDDHPEEEQEDEEEEYVEETEDDSDYDESDGDVAVVVEFVEERV